MTDRPITASPEARIQALTRRLSDALNEAALWEAAYYTICAERDRDRAEKPEPTP